MVKRKGGKKDILGVKKQLIDLMADYVCLCGTGNFSLSDPNPFFPKSFQLFLNGYSVLDPKDVKHLYSDISINIGDEKQEPNFEVLQEKGIELAELINNKIDKDIKCLGVCKQC